MTVYTRTGDKGTSSLYNGTRQTKGSEIFHALGMTDSLNSHLGVARESIPPPHALQRCALAASLRGAQMMTGEVLLSQKPMAKGLQLCDELEQLQSTLIDLGAAVATPPSSSTAEQLERVAFDGAGRAKELEKWIDAHEEELPPLRTFVLPGGGVFAAHLHVARTVARETERSLVATPSNILALALTYGILRGEIIYADIAIAWSRLSCTRRSKRTPQAQAAAACSQGCL